MDISGKLIQLLQLQTGNGKNGQWKKQEFILETGDTYPKKVCIAVWGDKIDLNSFKIGDALDVSFDVESREYNGKWYTDVKAWKVNASSGAKPSGGNGRAASPAPAQQQSYNDLPASDADDLPF